VIHALVTTIALLATLPARTDQMIYDTAGVIDDAAEQRLERDVHAVWQASGVAIVVITVPALEDETIDQLAVRAGQTWGVGQRGEDKGLVVAFSRDDRKIFVATGYGTEGYLNDGRVGQLLDKHALPDLKANRFSDGLVKLTDAIILESKNFAGKPRPQQQQRQQQQQAPGWLTWIGGVVGLLLLLWVARRNPLALMFMGGNLFNSGGGYRDRGGFGGGFGGGGFGGGGFGGGGAGRDF
jgi:uncharacterized protein